MAILRGWSPEELTIDYDLIIVYWRSKMTKRVKLARSQYTLEFKTNLVQQIKEGQSLSSVSSSFGVPVQTLHTWVKRYNEGELKGASSTSVSIEQMEISRLKAENAQLRMERDILKKATAFFAKDVK